MKRIIALLLTLVLVLSLAACGSKTVDTPAKEEPAKEEVATTETPAPAEEPATADDMKKYEGQTLTIWSFTDELKPAIAYFEEKFGVKVELTIIPTADYLTTLNPALESGVGAPDVYTAEAAFVEELVNNGFYMNLSEKFGVDKWADDYTDYVFSTGSDYDGNVRGLSWQMTPGGLFYRRSIAKEVLGTDDPAEISKMFSTFDGLFEVGTKMVAAGYKLFPDEGAFRHFTNPEQAPWVDADNKLVLPQSKLDYFDYSKRLRDENMTALAGEWSPAWFGAMSGPITVGETTEETTVFAFALPTWGLHYVLKTAKDGANPTSGDWGVASGPNAYFWGGTWLGIYKDSEKADLAFEFVRLMAHDEEFLKGWLMETGDVTSVLSIQQQYVEGFAEPFLAEQNHVKFFVEAGKAIDANRITKYDKDLDPLFGEAVATYVNGTATKEEALQNFKDAVQAAYPEIIIE